jgi:structural maintenance of chromosome 1
MQSAEGQMQGLMNKKRDVAMERKEARLEKEEAKKYQQLKSELVSFLFGFPKKV